MSVANYSEVIARSMKRRQLLRVAFLGSSRPASARAIARALNAKGIVGPDGNSWNDSTIRGHVKRGTGLINNELYVGRLVWNRQRYVKGPSTGRRVSRMNAESEWIVTEVPELRIIDDELWQAVKTRQSEIADKYLNVTEAIREAQSNRLNGLRRPKALFSGLIHCGVCGGPCSLRGQDRTPAQPVLPMALARTPARSHELTLSSVCLPGSRTG